MKRHERTERITTMKYEKDFVGKYCLVTGATSGIGKSVAFRLLEAGSIFFNVRRYCDNGWSSRTQTG